MRCRGQLSWAGIATLLVVVLSSCSGPPVAAPTGRVSDQITLSTTRVVAGSPIKGTFIVTNLGHPINLTLASKGCMPGFQVFLEKGELENAVGFDEPCVSTPFVIEHGTNRFPFRTFTRYTGCAQPGGTITPGSPPCLASGAYPPLPAGSYQAVIDWTNTVPLPRPAAVTVTITDRSS